MITRNEKAKGLWWRLLATLPVLAILMIANTKVAAQEQKAEKNDIKIETGWFEVYDDFSNPRYLTDTIIYHENGSYVQFKTTEASDPITRESREKMTITTHNADGTTTGQITDLYMVRNDNDTVFQITDEMPEFPGGVEAMMKYIAENVKYPEEAKDKEIAGRVFLAFVVEKDGSVSNVEVKRGIGGGCDEEALRVVKAMPKWKPGKKDGKFVRVSYMLPINFKLTDDIPMKSVKKTEASKPDMKPDENGVYKIVEEMPSFPGGDQKLMEYIAKNITYPQEARDKGIDGRVFVGMVIEKDGSVSNVKVLRGIGGGCDEEAVRVISSMPKWKPGMVGGEPVPVSYMLPVNFKLTEKQPKK